MPTGGAGRPRGSTNRNTKIVKEILEAGLGKTLPQALLDELTQIRANHEFKAAMYEKLMRYCYPMLTSVQVSHIEEQQEDQTKTLEDLKAKFRVISSE